MDDVFTMNDLQQTPNELIVKGEISDDAEKSVKCGEVFFLRTEQIVLICGFCGDSYNNMHEFGDHVQALHLNRKHPIEKLEVKPEQDENVLGPEISINHLDIAMEAAEDEKFDYEDLETTSESEYQFEPREPKRRRNRCKAASKTKANTNSELYCTICQIQYETNYAINLHNERKHNVLQPCRYCDKPFDSLAERTEHEKIHVGNNPYPCPKCSLSFKKRFTRNKHVLHVHEGYKPHKCSVCDRSFATGTILRAHEATHELNCRFNCELCHRKFAHESTLKYHMRSHTGEKPFQCEECGNRYSKQSLLTYHKRLHTGEKNFECETCGRKYHTPQNLYKHRSTVHSVVKKYICPTCGAGFKKSDSRNQHMKLHSDAKEYSCDICGKEFAQAAGLYSHRKSHTKM